MSRSPSQVRPDVEQWLAGPTRMLAFVMGLPLVDGIFPALVLAGALDSPLGVVQVGVLVFGGSATIATILGDAESGRRRAMRRVLTVGIPLVLLATVEAVLAPTIASLLDVAVFERFAALVLLAVAARTASARVSEYLPGPGIIVALGLVASVDPGTVAIEVAASPAIAARGAAAASIGVLLALCVAALRPTLAAVLDADRFRFGSAMALGTLGLSVAGLVPVTAPFPLLVLALAGLLAFDPGGLDEEAAPGPDAARSTDGGTDSAEADIELTPWF